MLNSKKERDYKKMARYPLFLVGLAFVIVLAWKSWDEISGFMEKLDEKEFLLSLVVGVVGNLVTAGLFKNLLGKHGVEVSGKLALKMFLIGQIAKYIPGKIWGMAYQILHLSGLAAATGLVLANLEMMVAVMFITAIIALVLSGILINKLLAAIIFIVGMFGFVFLYKKNMLRFFVKFMPAIVKPKGLFKEDNYHPLDPLTGGVFFIAFVLFYVVSNMLMLNAVFGFSIEESLVYIATLSAAWIGGVLAIIVPAGMGVREVLFVAFSNYVSPGHAVEMLVSIAVVSRFWQILQELVGIVLLGLIRH
jgi:hypothetical protein